MHANQFTRNRFTHRQSCECVLVSIANVYFLAQVSAGRKNGVTPSLLAFSFPHLFMHHTGLCEEEESGVQEDHSCGQRRRQNRWQCLGQRQSKSKEVRIAMLRVKSPLAVGNHCTRKHDGSLMVWSWQQYERDGKHDAFEMQ